MTGSPAVLCTLLLMMGPAAEQVRAARVSLRTLDAREDKADADFGYLESQRLGSPGNWLCQGVAFSYE